MVKKKTHSKKHFTRTNTHFMVRRSLLVYALLVFVLFFMLSTSVYLFVKLAEHKANTERLNQINGIYHSLNLDESYRPARSDVFGDKRVYDWDKNRSYSSVVEYAHNDSPANTRIALTKKIEATGFKKVGSAYEGSIAVQDHFKNDKGQYVRLTVTNKIIQDEMIYGPAFTDLGNPARMDTTTAPSYVTIKVNLDDNNE